jgi:hypothetical protein
LYDDLIIYADFSLGDFRDRTGLNTLSPSNVELVKSGNSYSALFNGTNSTLITNSTDPEIWQNGFTLVAWVNNYGWGGNTVGRIFDKATGAAANDGFYFCLYSLNERLYTTINNGGGKSSSNNSINLNKWQFVVLTINANSKINFYIGDLDNDSIISGSEDQESGSISGITTTNPLTIGNRSTALDRTFDGQISMAQAYSKVLTLEKITRIYKSTKWMVE